MPSVISLREPIRSSSALRSTAAEEFSGIVRRDQLNKMDGDWPAMAQWEWFLGYTGDFNFSNVPGFYDAPFRCYSTAELILENIQQHLCTPIS